MRKETKTILDVILRCADDPVEIAVILSELEMLKAAGFSQLVIASAHAVKPPDELLEIGTVAQRMKVSKTYLYRRGETLPFVRREGRKLLFSARGLDAYLKKPKGKNA